MTQEELERRLGQLVAGGDTGKLRYSPTVTRKRIKNPSASANGGSDADALADIEVVVQGWEDPDTGARLEAYQGPDGAWVIEKDVPGTKTPAPATGTRSTAAAADPNTPQGRAELEAERERQWNQANGGLYETHAQRREREAREARDAEAAKPRPSLTTTTINGQRYTTQTTPGVGGAGPKIEHFGPDGKPITKLPVETKQAQSSTVTVNGRTYVRHVVPKSDGTNEVYHTDQAGNRVELPQEGNLPLPAGMPPFQPQFGVEGYGLYEYTAQLLELQKLGKLTDIQVKEFLTRATEMTRTAAGQWDTQIQAQEQQQTNAINQRGTDIQASISRLNSSNTATKNALDTSLAIAGNVTTVSYDAAGGPLLPAVLGVMNANAMAWGGLNTPPQIGTAGYPMLDQLANATPAAPIAPTLPTQQQMANAGQPNQIGAGAIGAVPPPSGTAAPVAAGVAATQTAAANPTGANVEAANRATQAGFRAAAVPLVQPPVFAPPPPVPGSTSVLDMPASAPPPVVPTGGQQSYILPAARNAALVAGVAGSRAGDPAWQEAVSIAARELGLV